MICGHCERNSRPAAPGACPARVQLRSAAHGAGACGGAPRRPCALLVGVATLLLAAGCAQLSPRSCGRSAADEATAARVYAALKADPLHFYPALEVRVEGGVAYLTGLAFDGPDRDAATWLARDVPGVTAVTNAIAIVAGR